MRKRLWDLAKSRIEIATILPGHRHKVRQRRLHRRVETPDVDLPFVHPVLRLEAAPSLVHALVPGVVAGEVQLRAGAYLSQDGRGYT